MIKLEKTFIPINTSHSRTFLFQIKRCINHKFSSFSSPFSAFRIVLVTTKRFFSEKKKKRFSSIFFFSAVKSSSQQLTIRGRVKFSGASRLIEPGSKVQVQLQDTSLADAPAQVISQYIGSANRFPVAFALKYSPSSVISGFSYSLSVRIVNSKNELLFINDVHIPVKPTGADRTKFIDVSVIQVKRKSTR